MDVRMPDGTIISNVPEGVTQQEVLSRYNASKGASQPQKQTIHTEETVYDPMGGIISSPSYGPETTGWTDISRKVLTGAAALPVSTAMGVAKGSGAIGIPQALSKLTGGKYGDELVNAVGQIEKGMEQQGGEYLQKGANIVGQAAPFVMSGMPSAMGSKAAPLSTDVTSKIMGLSEKIPALPSYAKNVIGGATVGAASGLVTPEAPTANLADYLREKSLGTATNTLTGGVIPAVVEPTAKALGWGLRKMLGTTTGAGEKAFEEAYKAGKTGNQSFTTQFKDDGSKFKDVLNIANQDLKVINKKLSDQYKSGMIDVSADKSVLDFGNIDKAIKEAKDFTMFNGQVIKEGAYEQVKKAEKVIEDWKKLDPKKFRTPEAMDKLKQKIGDILEEISYEAPTSRQVVGDIYNSVKGEIAQQAPTYNQVMKDYHDGMELVSDIKKTLSLGQGKNTETGIKKLQSIMRNNANTSWGNRLALAQKLEQEGGGELMPALAGQALNTWTPRSLAGAGADLGAILATVGLGSPSALSVIPLTSPKGMGYLTYGAGKASNAKDLARLLTIQEMNRLNQGEK